MTILRETTAARDRQGRDRLRHPRRRAQDAAATGSSPAWARRRRAPSSRAAAPSSRRRTARRRSRPAPASSSSSPDRVSYPKLSPTFESTVPGIFVIGALAGYPLIKHCMNQGYDVVEFINGNTELKPADEPILEKKFAGSAGPPQRRRMARPSCAAGSRSSTRCRCCRCASSCSIPIRSPTGPATSSSSATSPAPRCSRSPTARSWSRSIRPIPPSPCRSTQGSIVGEVGLISGRKRGATVRAASGAIVVEIPRNAALKLMSTVPAAKREITRISTERQLLQMLGSGVSREDLVEVLEKRRDRQRQGGRGDHHRRRGELRHLRHPPGLDGGREGYRRQAGLPLLPSRRLLCRRDGADRRRPAHRDGARRDQVGSDQAERRRLPPPARGQARAARAASRPTWRRGRSSPPISRTTSTASAASSTFIPTSPASWSTTASARRPTCC